MTWTPFVAEDIRACEGAVCFKAADISAWFPTAAHEWNEGGSAREAVEACRTCPARFACLQAAVRHGEQDGIWGGFNFADRAQRQRARNLLRRKAA